jgi:hypothetical protein
MIQTVQVGPNGAGVAFGHGSAWVALGSGTVVRLTR